MTALEITAADDYPLADVMWTFVTFFALLVYFWLVITVFCDLFRRHDISGWGKAGGSFFFIFLPLIGSLTYLITQGRAMADRNVRQVRETRQQNEHYNRPGAAPRSPRRR